MIIFTNISDINLPFNINHLEPYQIYYLLNVGKI
jgi:hypothetical protein